MVIHFLVECFSCYTASLPTSEGCIFSILFCSNKSFLLRCSELSNAFDLNESTTVPFVMNASTDLRALNGIFVLSPQILLEIFCLITMHIWLHCDISILGLFWSLLSLWLIGILVCYFLCTVFRSSNPHSLHFIMLWVLLMLLFSRTCVHLHLYCHCEFQNCQFWST